MQQKRAAKTKPNLTDKSLIIRGAVNTYTAYGQLTCNIVSELEKLGYESRIFPISVDEPFGTKISEEVKSHLVFKPPFGSEWELALYSPLFAPKGYLPGVKRIMLTMWETDKLKPEHVKGLNKCHCVITPSKWCYETFKTSGVRVPIHLLPLGFDSDSFYPDLSSFPPTRIFGAAGRLAHGGVRKGVNQVITAFKKAFPIEEDAELHVKVFPDCAVGNVFDSRIKVDRTRMSKKELRDWYLGLSCFVSMSTSEGWGLHQVEALACGRPLVSVNYGGVKEFFKPEVNGYEVGFKEELSHTYEYDRVGKWAKPSEKDVVKQMRRVYENPVEAFCLGLQGAQDVKELSFKNFMLGLVSILKQEGALA